MWIILIVIIIIALNWKKIARSSRASNERYFNDYMHTQENEYKRMQAEQQQRDASECCANCISCVIHGDGSCDCIRDSTLEDYGLIHLTDNITDTQNFIYCHNCWKFKHK